jgi:hypothetical protein
MITKIRQQICVNCGFDKLEYRHGSPTSGGCECISEVRESASEEREVVRSSRKYSISGSEFGVIDALRLIEVRTTYEDYLTDLIGFERSAWD